MDILRLIAFLAVLTVIVLLIFDEGGDDGPHAV